MIRGTFALVSSVLLLGSVAGADEVSSTALTVKNFYVQVEGGMAGIDFNSGGYNTLGDFYNTGDASNLSFYRGLALGYYIDETYRLDISYRKYDKDDYVTNSYRPPVPTFFYKTNMKTSLLMFSIYRKFASFGPEKRMSVYAGFGIGRSKVDLYTNDTVVEGSGSKHHIAWQIEGGVNYNLNQHFQWYTGVRYVNMGKFSIKLHRISNPSASAGNFSTKLHSSELYTGIRFKF